MREHLVEDIVETPGRIKESAYKVIYDGQCEICQACVSWLKALDHEGKTICLPISAQVLAAVDSRLGMEECLQQLHVLGPDGEIRVGWDAVACLTRLFPPTWLIGAAGQRFPLRSVGRLFYGFIARNRYSLGKCRGGACQVAKPEVVRREARLSAFWSCYTLGCFPWGRRTSWESCATDECIRLLSLGHFSRTELVRSFVRTNSDQLPTVYEVRISAE